MKYDERLKNLWRACSREDSRYSLQAARLDCDKKVISATDGLILAVLDVTDLMEPKEKSFTIPVDALKAAQSFFSAEKRKEKNSRRDIFIRNSGDSITVSVGLSKRGQSFECEARQYPQWEAITLDGKNHGVAITLSVGLLTNLAMAMRGNYKAEDSVSLSVQDKNSVVLVSVNGSYAKSYGMLMPMRIDHKTPKRFWMGK